MEFIKGYYRTWVGTAAEITDVTTLNLRISDIYICSDSNVVYRWSGIAWVDWSAAYQALLVSGNNIKTINGVSVLGTGDITIGGGDMVIDALPGNGYLSGAVLVPYLNNPVIRLQDAQNQFWYPIVKIPLGATSIASIKLKYISNSTGNLYMLFHTYSWDGTTPGTQKTDTSDTLTAYAGAGVTDEMNSITIPVEAYSNLTNLKADDIVSLIIRRAGNEADDTYNAHLYVLTVEFTFA